jgi:hypothetical protein
MSDDDPQFNLLNRLRKRSPRLVCEEYGSWEVPVGCGGMVLHWRDPADGYLFVLNLAVMGDAEVRVDGMPVEHLLQLRPGPHELLIDLRSLPDHPSPFGFELRSRVEADEDTQLLLSAAAGGFFLREGPDDRGRPLEPFAGDLVQATGGRNWWFQAFEESALLSLPPHRALLYRKLEVRDARTLW